VNTNSPYGKIYKRTAKISKAMEEQFKHFIYITYQGKENGSILSTNKRCTSSWSEHKFFLWQNVWAAQQISLIIILTFDCGNGETIYTFHLYNLPKGV